MWEERVQGRVPRQKLMQEAARSSEGHTHASRVPCSPDSSAATAHGEEVIVILVSCWWSLRPSPRPWENMVKML